MKWRGFSASSGVALVMTLLFTLLISSLVLSGMGQMNLRLKIFSQLKQKQDLFYHAESGMLRLYRRLKAGEEKACIVASLGLNDFFDKPSVSSSCQHQGGRYHDLYIIEERGLVACREDEDPLLSTLWFHYRINLISRVQSLSVGLQVNVVIAKNNRQQACHVGEPRVISEGFKSWREK